MSCFILPLNILFFFFLSFYSILFSTIILSFIRSLSPLLIRSPFSPKPFPSFSFSLSPGGGKRFFFSPVPHLINCFRAFRLRQRVPVKIGRRWRGLSAIVDVLRDATFLKDDLIADAGERVLEAFGFIAVE